MPGKGASLSEEAEKLVVATAEQPLDYSSYCNNYAALDLLGGFVLFLADDGYAGDPAED